MVERAAVELDEVDVVGGQAPQAALDAGEQWSPTPVGASPAAGVATFGEQIKLVPSSADGLADQDLAVLVALGGVDRVQTSVEGAAEQAGDGTRAHALVSDLGAAEAEHARDDVGAAETAALQRSVRSDASAGRHEDAKGTIRLQREKEDAMTRIARSNDRDSQPARSMGSAKRCSARSR